MKFQGELPPVENRRVGPGWWMDGDGSWQSPREWPEDYPPIKGWVPDPAGGWMPPSPEALRRREETRWLRHDEEIMVEAAPASTRSLADRRDVLFATGAILGVLVVLVGALIVITQAGAADDDNASAPATTDAAVIYPAETDADLRARRAEVAATRPDWARTTLAELPDVAPVPAGVRYDRAEWTAPDDGCLSVTERVLIDRSRIEVSYADQIDCVLDTGLWYDRYVDRQLRRAITVEVALRVPADLAFAAGGWNWDRDTRDAYLVDLAHPAHYEIVAADAGHNPRRQGPEDWKPASESLWCASAIDWIAVKQRWSLGVTTAERSALVEMLDTCDDADSLGADPATTPIEEPIAPTIGLLEG